MRRALWLFLVSLLTAAPAVAQPVVESAEVIDFDRAEAWAMAYFGSAGQLTSFGLPVVREPWSLDLDLELSWIPRLDQDQRRVGFNGTKVEDLNRVPAVVRPRLAVWLPGRLLAELAWVPPIEVDGMTTNLVSLGLGARLVERPRWGLGLRAFAQWGQSEGDLTCTAREAAIPPGDPGNAFGCEAPSNDTATLDHAGLELVGAWRPRGPGGLAFHLGLARVRHDLEFQVDALTYGFRDRTRLTTEGWTTSFTAGVSAPVGDRVEVTVEAYYVPLDVRRGPGAPPESEPLINVRALLRYRFR